MAQNQADERLRLRRVLPERAIALAMQNRWREAADVNRTILKIDPNDADAYNRLGKALLELGQIREAYDAYTKAVELSPTNMIAQKNMQRLAPLVQQGATVTVPTRATPTGEAVRPQTFIEETGKTGLSTLINLASGPTLLTLTAGDRVILRVDSGSLLVYTSTEAGSYLGQVEPKLAHRLIKFIEGGNRYSATVTTVSEKSLTIIIREIYQAPTMQGRPSFPAKAVPAAYRTAREGVARYGAEDDDEGFGEDYDTDTDTDAEEPEEEAEFEDDEIDDR